MASFHGMLVEVNLDRGTHKLVEFLNFLACSHRFVFDFFLQTMSGYDHKGGVGPVGDLSTLLELGGIVKCRVCVDGYAE
jgi:hypothetical protein